MPMCLVVTGDVQPRYRGFLGSLMLELAPGVYVSPRMSKAVRERVWTVVGDWHATLGEGSVTMAWREKSAPGGVRVSSLEVARSQSHGHVEALGLALRRLGFDTLIDATIRLAGSPRVGLCAWDSLIGTSGDLLLRHVRHASTFLPPFPKAGLCCPAVSRSVWTESRQSYASSDSCPARTHPTGLSASFASPSEHPTPNHIVRLDIALSVTSAYRVDPKAQASPCSSRLATSRRRNGFVILQAARSPLVALHPASRRRSYHRLHRS